MPKKGLSSRAELHRRQLPSKARAAKVDLDSRHESARVSESDRTGPIWAMFDIRVSVVAKGTQHRDADGEIGDLRPPPVVAVRRPKKLGMLEQWISYASRMRKGVVVLHGLMDALKRMFGA
jgi:hypothetical protein